MQILKLISLLTVLTVVIDSQAETNPPPIIEVEVARFVAAEHVHANNQPFQWRYLDHVVLYDVDGNPNAYAFRFCKSASRLTSPKAFQKHIADVTTEIQARPSPQAGVPDDELYLFEELATVITGATSCSPLILRHFRGAPEFWIQASRLDLPATRKGGKPRTPTHVIMVTPMDFRLLLADAGVGVAFALEARPPAKATLAGSADALSVRAQKTERLSVLRQAKESRNAREQQRLERMDPDQRQQFERALKERAAALAAEWNKKRTDTNARANKEAAP